MTSTKAVTAADKDALKALYDEAVAEINVVRGSNTLTSDFYARTGAALFEAGCLALSDAITDMRRMHTVSAPAGGGKTSFAYALVAAVTRYAEHRPEAPYGSVFVVGEIEKADQVYRDLNDLLPGKVAVWTTDHDRGGKEPEKIKEPAKRFDRNELRHFPVIVVTHNFYLKTNGHYARDVMRNGVSGVRALTLVDEKPDEAPMIEVELSEAQ
jgi:hypothetical protein